jgi:hypothetical protein
LASLDIVLITTASKLPPLVSEIGFGEVQKPSPGQQEVESSVTLSVAGGIALSLGCCQFQIQLRVFKVSLIFRQFTAIYFLRQCQTLLSQDLY